MNKIVALDNPLLKNQQIPPDRVVKLMPNLELPKNTVIVSADSHWEIETDIFVERLPKEMRDRAPRMWLDRFMRIGFPDKDGAVACCLPPASVEVAAAATCLPGIYNLDARMADLDTEGIQKEINFPSLVLACLHHPDYALREAVFRVYNEYIAERGAATKGRSFGVGVLSNWWDPDKAKSAVQQIKDLGLKTFMLPVNPGVGRDGRQLVYSEAEMDAMWTAIADSGIPVCFHIGESGKMEGRGGVSINHAVNLQPFVPVLARLIFGGIFDRNPSLRVVFGEGGIAWVPVALQDFENVYDCYPGLQGEWRPKNRPTDYWAKHCYATFMNDQLGLEQIKYIGADKVMWSSDYPHGEGTWAYSQSSMRNVIEAVSEDEARDILGGTAIKVFGL